MLIIDNTLIDDLEKCKIRGINDEPEGKKDLLNYNKYAIGLSKIILDTSILLQLLCIYSEWGSGKSY